MARNKIMPRNLHTGKNSTIKQFDILRKSCPGEDSSVQELCPGACNKPITNPGEFSFPSAGPKKLLGLQNEKHGSSNIQAHSGRDGAPKDVNHKDAALRTVRSQ
jgi:hypothetical protein